MLKEEIIVTTQLRNAAGVCALSIGLLVCSSAGAIAVADAETGGVSDSPGGDTTTADRTTTTSTSDGPTNTVDTKRDDEETGDDGDDGTVTVTQGTTSGTTNLQSLVPTVGTEINTSDEGDGLTDVTALDLDGAEVGTTLTSTVAEMPSVPTSSTFSFEFTSPSGSNETSPSGSNKTPAAETTPAGHGSGGAPVSKADKSWDAEPTAINEAGQITSVVVTRVSNAFASFAQGLGQAVDTLAQLPYSETPITDLIQSVVVMVGGVWGAVVEVAHVPGDLAALFGVSRDGVHPPLIGVGGTVSAPRTPVDLPFLAPNSQPTHGLVPTLEPPLSGSQVQPSNVGGAAASGLKTDLTLSGLAPVPSGITPATKSFLDHVVRSVLAPASLTALAAIAVPGVAGLLIVCAAGIRVGYRQAKAGLALRVSGIARFAGSGPMGVVRSGGLIALHTRTPRLGKPHASRAIGAKTANAPHLLESVA
ncbi:hypothetical protein [Mycobacterium neglectum]|uniref:hypothetical protein n=1 Tax=Mycobacterium neglectum TaxID=242737 RepID=UPI000BFEC19B|nr:hypothetical protein [Mycobacterium neglectum]